MGLFSDHKAKKEAENMGAMGAGHCCGGHDGHGMASNMAIPRRTLRRTRSAA